MFLLQAWRSWNGARGVALLAIVALTIRARLAQELKNWIGDAEQYDDLTFVVMKVN